MVIEAEAAVKVWVKSVDKKFSDAKARAKEMLQGGFTVPGYKLVAGRKSPPKYRDESEAVKVAKSAKVDPYETVMLSPAKLRDALLAEGLDTETVMGLFEVTQGVELAPESSKKPALPVGPDAVFN